MSHLLLPSVRTGRTRQGTLGIKVLGLICTGMTKTKNPQPDKSSSSVCVLLPNGVSDLPDMSLIVVDTHLTLIAIICQVASVQFLLAVSST